MMKQLQLIFLYVALCTTAIAQQSVFYELTGEGIQTSYILATLPTTDERTFNLSDSVFWAFDQAEAVATTALVDSAGRQQLKEKTQLPDNEVFDFTNNKHFGRLDALTEELTRQPIWPYQRWSPVYLRDQFQKWILDAEDGQSVTGLFQNLAKTQEKKVVSPLQVKDWTEVINNIPVLVQSDMLVHYLRLKDNNEHQERVLNQFMKGNIDKLKQVEHHYRHIEQFHSYWYPLARKFATRMVEQAARQSTFYLADAAMMSGDHGLLALLEDKGIEVRPVGTGFSYEKDQHGTVKGLVTFSDTTIFEPGNGINYYELNTEFEDAYFEDIVPGWYKLTSYRGGFSVRMPGPPEIIREKLPAEAGGMNMYLYRYEDSKDRNLYLVSFFDYPREAEVKGTKEFFQRAIAQTVQRFNGLLLKERDISTDEYKGREVEMQGEDNMIIRVRFYLIGQRLYQVVLSAEDKKAFSKTNQAFYNSFKILDVFRRPWLKVNTAIAEVSFPGEVAPSIERLPFEDTVTTTLHYHHTAPQTNLQYSASITFLPYRHKLDNDIDAYERMAYKTIEQIDGVLVDESYSETKDYREFYLEAGGRQEQMIRTRIFINRKTVIQLLVMGPEDSARSSFADRFLNSYRLHPDYR